MSFNTPDIKKLEFHKVLRISTVEYEQDKGAFKAAYQQEMREGLAHHIQHARVDLNVTKDFIEAKLDLYVATPEEFWALVNFQAERIANRYSRTIDSTGHARTVELYRALSNLVSASDKGEGVMAAHEEARKVVNGK